MSKVDPPTSAVVVTGASSGIGESTAVRLAQRGYLALAGVRNERDAQRLAALHANILPLHLDVADVRSIETAARMVEANGVPVIGLVSNAGIVVAGPLEHVPLDELRRQFDVNVFGAIAFAQTFLPLLRGRRSRIVFVGSISGRLAIPYIAPYSASKFALRAIAEAWRVELAPSGIAVSLVEPGSVKTPIWQKGRNERDEMFARIPASAPAYYRDGLEAVVRGTEYEERHAMPVERVSDAILHALTANTPRARYLLGTPARLGSILALLPPALHDHFIRASMRLP